MQPCLDFYVGSGNHTHGASYTVSTLLSYSPSPQPQVSPLPHTNLCTRLQIIQPNNQGPEAHEVHPEDELISFHQSIPRYPHIPNPVLAAERLF